MYRKPGSNIEEFQSSIEHLVNITKYKTLYICGDFNIDLIKYNSHEPSRNFTDSLFSLGLIPLITMPTRITNTSETLIDNIFTNNLSTEHSSGILIADVSDHLPIFTLLNEIRVPKKSGKRYVFKRKINNETIANLNRNLSEESWSNIYGCSDVNKAYGEFINTFNRHYHNCCPITKYRTSHKNEKPWFTKGLKNACRKKNNLYYRFLKTKSTVDEVKYKTYKNKLTQILRRCERNYYDECFEKAKGDMRASWKLINDLTKKNSKPTNELDCMLNDNTSKSDIANGFNHFFTKIGPNLANQINKVPGKFDEYLNTPNQHTMLLCPVTDKELVDTILNFQGKSSLDCHGMSMDILKKTAPNIIAPLLDICNQSFQQGKFPDMMKSARVIPIFKSGDKTDYNNYRPISLLPQFSKILEKLFNNRLDSFIQKFEILYQGQYGFQNNRSTASAVLELIEEVTNNIDKKKVSAGIFIDLKKAFDTVNHDILIKKLEYYGLRGTALSWINSYLINRTQFVDIDNTKSEELNVECGVPQGSVLGPKLFLLYINDIIKVSDLLKFILFADDTTILCSDSDIASLTTKVNRELDKLFNWFAANKLSLNIAKTNYMIFNGGTESNITHPITINNTAIEKVKVSKFLGVLVDDKVSWKPHILSVQSKLSKTLAAMYHARPMANDNTMRTIYNALFLPHLSYCAEIWGNTYSSNLSKIKTTQKKAIRLICRSGKFSHTTPLFKQLNLLKFTDVVEFKTSLVMHKAFHSNLPPNNQKFFQKRVSKYPTKHKNKLDVKKHRTTGKSFTMSITGVKVWNSLDITLTDIISHARFKTSLKKRILATYSN